jgi:hypothetical protein
LKSPYPQTGNKIEVYFGQPIDFTEKVAEFRRRYPGKLDEWRSSLESLKLYAEITKEIRTAILQLEAKAWRRGYQLANTTDFIMTI